MIRPRLAGLLIGASNKTSVPPRSEPSQIESQCGNNRAHLALHGAAHAPVRHARAGHRMPSLGDEAIVSLAQPTWFIKLRVSRLQIRVFRI